MNVKPLTGDPSGVAFSVQLCTLPGRSHMDRRLGLFPRLTVLALVDLPPELQVRSEGTVRW